MNSVYMNLVRHQIT